jgi:hypothetical protein
LIAKRQARPASLVCSVLRPPHDRPRDHRGTYGRLKTSEKYVSPAELKQIVAVRQTRTEVTQRFGEPTAVIDDVQAIGYEVCIDSEGVEVAVIIVPLPIWHNGLTKDCQRIGLWFDAQERAIGWREETMHMGESSSGWYHANLADWMSTNRPETR